MTTKNENEPKCPFRSVGFTPAAAEFPRDELAIKMLAAFNNVSPEQLTEVDWISLNTSNHLNHLTLSGPGGEVCKLRLEPRVAANGMLAVRQFTLDGLGVSYQPLPEVRDALNDGRLQQLLPEWRIPGLGIYAVTPRREAQPAKVKVAIEALRRAFATDGDERWS